MPKKRGGRSPHARQRRHASRIVSKNAHRDYRKAESINTITDMDLYNALQEKFGMPYISIVQSYERGEVISDGRGEGTHDRPPKKEKRTWNPTK